MKTLIFPQVLLISISIVIMDEAHSTLINRGGGLIFDDILNITWQQNANLPVTNTFDIEGIDANGYMDWPTANAWIDAMNSVNYLGYDDWRLPVTEGTFNPFGLFAPIDCRFASEEVARGDEMGHLFYHTLNGQFGDNLTGNQGLFINVQGVYWYGIDDPVFNDSAYGFIFGVGIYQNYAKSTIFNYAWAVRDGDVIPEPITVVLLSLGGLLIRIY